VFDSKIPENPTPSTTTIALVPQDNEYTTSKIIASIKQTSHDYGVDENLALSIAYAESGYNPNARNKSSSAGGVYQFLDSTWATTMSRMGITGNKFDAETNIKAGIWLLSRDGTRHWQESAHLWWPRYKQILRQAF